MSDAPLLVIAAGGTGGHMFPAQALAEAMLRKGWRVKLSTDARGGRFTGGFPHSVTIEEVASATTARGGLSGKVLAPVRILVGIAAATLAMLRDRPAIVVGFGGYPTIPAMSAAWLLRRPRMIHEQNGVLGRVNQVFARRVHRVACGVWPTTLPPGTKAEHVGNPVRAAVLQRAGAPYFAPGDFPMSLVVMGGSQGAQILSDFVPQSVAMLPDALKQNIRVTHQARAEDEARVRAFYAENGIDAEVAPFFQDIPKRLDQAQLVISRAGASSIADISVIGRPSILVPFARATGDHQTANARMLVAAEAAILIPEGQLVPATLATHIETILSQPAAADQMAQNAKAAGRPDATERLVALVDTLTSRGSQ